MRLIKSIAQSENSTLIFNLMEYSNIIGRAILPFW